MAFGGGGGGQLTPHVHNSVPLQGGPLDFTNNTIASLTAGSTTFSDGAALQELVIGTPAQSLVVNGAGTAPEWGAAGSGGGGWEFVEEFTNPSKQVYFTCTLASPIVLADYNVMFEWWIKNESISSNMEVKIDDEVVYKNGSNSTSGWNVSGGIQIPADSWSIGHLTYYGNTIDTDYTMGFIECTHGKQSGLQLAGIPYRETIRQGVATTQIEEFKIFPTNGDQYADNIVRVYKLATS